MALTEDEIRVVLGGALDRLKKDVLDSSETFADKLTGNGLVMKASRLRPTRPDLPHVVVMLAVSNVEGEIANIRTAFESWGRQSTN